MRFDSQLRVISDSRKIIYVPDTVARMGHSSELDARYNRVCQ